VERKQKQNYRLKYKDRETEQRKHKPEGVNTDYLVNSMIYGRQVRMLI